MPFTVTRMPGNPIISPDTHPGIGHNIQGPSLIRVPDWVPNPLGRYYLFFADHKGDYIRLAVANDLHGPWRIHEPGALRLADSRYPTTPLQRPLDYQPPASRLAVAPPGTPGVPDTEEDATTPHIASPDVHVDHATKRLIMYFHGLAGYRVQQTRVATSANGLDWEVKEELLGPSYFRVFAHGGVCYAVVMPGLLFRSEDGRSRFKKVTDLFNEPRQRHTAVLKRGDTLFIFWTRAGDAPESIYVSRMALRGSCETWKPEATQLLLRPETSWEGAGLPVTPSYRSAVNIRVNQLRDPAIFEEDGATYLLYAIAGEAGIALARLQCGE